MLSISVISSWVVIYEGKVKTPTMLHIRRCHYKVLLT